MAWKRKLSEVEKVEYREKKQEEMQTLFRKIDDGVRDVFSSERYKAYLRFMSKFYNYSARNCMLICLQKPDATLIASYGKWKQLGRQVNKGESGIAILVPCPYKTENDDEEIVQMYFKRAFVFDVSQTSGKELPEYVTELQGEIAPEQMEAVFRSIRNMLQIPVTVETFPGSAHGYFSQRENKIVIQKGMSDRQTLKTLFHECAHKLLHDKNNHLAAADKSRDAQEIHAESVAFITAAHFGMDTSEYSFPYIASWSDGKPLQELNQVLSEIQTAA